MLICIHKHLCSCSMSFSVESQPCPRDCVGLIQGGAPRSGGAQGVDGRYNAWRSGAPGPHAHRNAARQVVDDRIAEVRGQQKPPQQPAQPWYANYWAPLTHKRRPPQPAQPQHTNDWAPRTQKQRQQEHRPQQPTKRSDPMQHATVQGPANKQQPDGMSHRGGGGCHRRGGMMFPERSLPSAPPCPFLLAGNFGQGSGESLWIAFVNSVNIPARRHMNGWVHPCPARASQSTVQGPIL